MWGSVRWKSFWRYSTFSIVSLTFGTQECSGIVRKCSEDKGKPAQRNFFFFRRSLTLLHVSRMLYKNFAKYLRRMADSHSAHGHEKNKIEHIQAEKLLDKHSRTLSNTLGNFTFPFFFPSIREHFQVLANTSGYSW